MAKKRVKAGTSRAEAQKRRALFVEAMADPSLGGNATKAAIKAGFGEKSARRLAARLMADPKIRAAVEARSRAVIEAACEGTELTAMEVMRSLARDLRFDPAKMLDERGQIKPLHEMDEDTRLALRGLEHEALFVGRGEDRTQIGTVHKVKFPEKTAAREQAMKHFGLYELDNRQKPAPTVNVGVLTVQPDGMHFEKVRARALQRA